MSLNNTSNTVVTTTKNFPLTDYSIFENSDVILVQWSFDEREHRYNYSYVSENIKHFGLKSRDIVNDKINVAEIIHPEDKESVLQGFFKAIRAEKGEYTNSYRLISSKGTFWVQDNGTFFRNKKDGIIYVQSILVNINHSKGIETELAQKNAYLNLLHETAISLGERQDLEKTLKTIIEQLLHFSTNTDTYICLKNPENTVLTLKVGTGMFEPLVGDKIYDYNFGATGAVWRSEQAEYVEDYELYTNRVEKEYASDIVSVACVPLIANGEFLGVIGYNSTVKIIFTDEIKALHLRFAQLVSLALASSQLVNELNTKLETQKQLEEQLRSEQSSLAQQVKFRMQLSELIEKSLTSDSPFNSNSFYKMILESTVKSISGAEAGSLLVRNNQNLFNFAAAINYNIEELKNIVLEEQELHFDATCKVPTLKYHVDNSKLDDEKQQGLKQKLNKLEVTLSIPIHINHNLIALINIDNFSNKHVFNNETIQLAKVLSRHVAALWKRFNLEKELSEQMHFRKNMALLVENSLTGRLRENFYQDILNRALKVLPEAEGGSLIVKNDEGLYSFKAAVGHDMKVLEKFILAPDQLYRDINLNKPMRVMKEEIVESNEKHDITYKGYKKQFQTVLSIPIHVNGEAVAMFNIDNFSNRNAFSEKSLKNGEIFAHQVSALWQRFILEKEVHQRELDYKELFNDAQQKTDELKLLHELQHALSSQLELNDLFEVSLKKIIEIFGYSQTYIRVLDGDQLRMVANQGFRNSLLPVLISTDHPVSRLLMEQKEFFLLNQESHEKYLPKGTKLFGASTMLLPILIQSKFWGFMGIGNKYKALEQHDFDIGHKVVELMSVAIENAQLHTHVKKDLRRNESLHKISQAVQEYDNLNGLMDSIVEYVRQAMNARWATLYNIDLNKQHVENVSTTDLKNSPLKILSFDELTSGLVGWAIKNNKVAHIVKGTRDERESPAFIQRIIDLDIGGVAVIPFTYGGNVEGTISVVNHIDDPDFSENDLQLLNTVANQVGAAIGKFKLMRQIEYQAFHDSLTHLPNRLQFENKISSMIKNAQRRNLQFAILFIDLDGFKHVNDTLGHALGDQLLISVANRIQTRKRAEDTLARMGGDEFAIVLTDVSSVENALKIANDYLKFFTEPYTTAGYELSIGASIGVSLYPENGQDIHTLLSNADSAMYQAKNAGKNSVSGFTQSLAEEVKERAKLERELKLAVERDELELHYQPQYIINEHDNTQEVIGLEALVRWRHPEKGLVSPGIFIPIAEESNLIIDVGNWVLNEACRQNAEWQAKGQQALRVAVNISSKQFVMDDFVETVIATLKKNRLQPEYLELEVTETVIMNDVQAVIERLKLLRNLNINIAIDDFGTGYSSLTYLQDLPLDKLKIDKSFVDKLEETANPAIIKTVLTLAQSLGLTTIAEGVETEKQLQILQELGCDEAQGFLFAKPLAATEVFKNFTVVNDGSSLFQSITHK